MHCHGTDGDVGYVVALMVMLVIVIYIYDTDGDLGHVRTLMEMLVMS